MWTLACQWAKLNKTVIEESDTEGGILYYVAAIISMYTKIPTARAIPLLIKILRDLRIGSDIIKEFQDLFNLCVNTNVCSFRGKTYKFLDGLPMGGPLSAMVADIFIGHLESMIIDSSPHATHIRHWARYFDDIFGIWHGPEASLHLLLQELNNFDPEIKFTLQIGKENINFLGINVSFIEDKNVLRPKFNTYRKETYTGISIHADSFHPDAHKMANINSLIQRLLHIPLDEAAVRQETQIYKASHKPTA